MPFQQFDRSRLILEPLARREHDLTLADILSLGDPVTPMQNPDMETIAQRVKAARARDASVILIMGAHVIRRGNSRLIIDLMEKGLITHVAMNGAGPIHDFEFALIGATTESVAKYIRTGQFGMWRETGEINAIARAAAREGIGLGEAIGRAIWEGGFVHRDVSVLAAGYRLQG